MKTPEEVLQVVLDHGLINNNNLFICHAVTMARIRRLITRKEDEIFTEWFKPDLIPEQFRGRYWIYSRGFWNTLASEQDGKLDELLQLKRECCKWLIENAEYNEK